jgi:hypothetical protein
MPLFPVVDNTACMSIVLWRETRERNWTCKTGRLFLQFHAGRLFRAWAVSTSLSVLIKSLLIHINMTTIEYLIQEKINRRLTLGNACYHSVQNLLSSRLLSKNIKIRIHKTIILPVVLYGCETLSLTLRKEHRLRVLRIFRPKSDEVTGGWRKLPFLSLQRGMPAGHVKFAGT